MATDDAVKPHGGEVFAGNGRVFVQFELPSPLMSFVVERVANREGSNPALIWQGEGSPLAPMEVPAVNGTEVCLRVRTVVAGAESSWSTVQCATPLSDPTRPAVAMTPLHRTHSRLFTLPIPATDDSAAMGVHHAPHLDPAASTSGLSEMRIATNVDFVGASWVPFAPTLQVWLPDARATSYYVQVRDRAGNMSNASSTIVVRISETAVDEAIEMEERALDAIAAGNLALARTEVARSLPKVVEAIRDLRERGLARRRQQAVKLELVLARKIAALAFITPAHRGQAEKILRNALADEREVSDALDATP